MSSKFDALVLLFLITNVLALSPKEVLLERSYEDLEIGEKCKTDLKLFVESKEELENTPFWAMKSKTYCLKCDICIFNFLSRIVDSGRILWQLSKGWNARRSWLQSGRLLLMLGSRRGFWGWSLGATFYQPVLPCPIFCVAQEHHWYTGSDLIKHGLCSGKWCRNLLRWQRHNQATASTIYWSARQSPVSGNIYLLFYN